MIEVDLKLFDRVIAFVLLNRNRFSIKESSYAEHDFLFLYLPKCIRSDDVFIWTLDYLPVFHVPYAFLYGLSNVQNSIVKDFLPCILRVWIWMRAAALDVGQRRVC